MYYECECVCVRVFVCISTCVTNEMHRTALLFLGNVGVLPFLQKSGRLTAGLTS